MAQINILDHGTIDQIAAGEVVERPKSIVKELVENALDAGSSAVTVEIKDGGISFIRVTDNGCGIEKTEIRKAFLRHATSKITSASDLSHIISLGFRGEALSSIAAVSQVELITKSKEELTGTRIVLEGTEEVSFEEIGAPEGTTIMVRNVFYHIPARRKFLKQPSTEASYIADLMEHLALSNPQVSFKFIQNGKTKFATSGNGNLKEVIYRIYGKEVVNELIELKKMGDGISVRGYLGKPSCNRSNRNFEIYFMNHRFIKSKIIAQAIEDGYHSYLMQHKYPFCVFSLDIDTEKVDVNVHPTKMDVRFEDGSAVYHFLENTIKETLKVQEMIPDVKLVEEKKEDSNIFSPEPFQIKARENMLQPSRSILDVSAAEKKQNEIPASFIGAVTLFDDEISKDEVLNESNLTYMPNDENATKANEEEDHILETSESISNVTEDFKPLKSMVHESIVYGKNLSTKISDNVMKQSSIIADQVQLELFETKILTPEKRGDFKILGQIFDTYWLVTYEDKLLMVDQHAAHEKVKYEKIMKDFHNGELLTQNLYPPIVVSLTGKEQEILARYREIFENLGFETEDFGGNEISIRTAPLDLYGASLKELFLEVLDELEDTGLGKFPSIEAKIASMSCKAAVKGNSKLTTAEMNALMDQLITLENPYFCPHGRPTMISFSQYEIEKKFKRIV